ncbi:MAG: hypothetical protein JW825_01515 [Candidatus Methanofastidiosa archaeon]|nr:hypothetical protein [Candidatus Methanofastidiosa archaeon]
MLSAGMRKFYIYILVFAIIAVFLFLPLIVPYLSRSADYSAFNDGWNGTSRFYKELLQNAQTGNLSYGDGQFLNTVIGDISNIAITSADDTIIVSIGASKEYSEKEKEFLKGFVLDGGTLLIADDFGSANGILESIGIDERFSNKLVMDAVYVKSGTFPVMYKGTYLEEYTLLLNYPSNILGASDPMFITTRMAFLDLNEDSSYDEGEPMGPFDISAMVEVGDGRICLISDPSIFINNMIGLLDNSDYIFSLMEELTDGYEKYVYIDEAHLGTLADIEFIEVVVRAPNYTLFRYLASAFLVALLFLETNAIAMAGGAMKWAIHKFKFGKGTTLKITDRKELIESLKEIHPEWRSSSLNSFFSKFR